MSQAIVTSQPLNLPSGTQNIPTTALPVEVTSLTISIARCTTATPTVWPDIATTLSLQLEISVDGGENWTPGGGLTAVGGIALNKHGVEFPVAQGMWTYPTPPTHMRGTLEVGGGPLVSAWSLAIN